MKLSLCLETVFADLPLVERIEPAARIGFTGIEFWDWKNKDLEDIRRKAKQLGVTVSAFSGNRTYSMTNPRDRDGFVEEVSQSLEAAGKTGCKTLMLLTNRLREDDSAEPAPAELTRQDQLDSIVAALKAVAGPAAALGVTLVLEPLNTKLDHPGYFLDQARPAFEIVRRLGAPNVRVLYDIYHMAMMGEDVRADLETFSPEIGYIHAADMPGRHEPGTGSIDFAAITSTLRSTGYSGTVGMEFLPSAPSREAARTAWETFSGS